jgi:hypothetical protein
VRTYSGRPSITGALRMAGSTTVAPWPILMNTACVISTMPTATPRAHGPAGPAMGEPPSPITGPLPPAPVPPAPLASTLPDPPRPAAASTAGDPPLPAPLPAWPPVPPALPPLPLPPAPPVSMLPLPA